MFKAYLMLKDKTIRNRQVKVKVKKYVMISIE